eukprot:2619379-Karenia_brevis.AAC.1
MVLGRCRVCSQEGQVSRRKVCTGCRSTLCRVSGAKGGARAAQRMRKSFWRPPSKHPIKRRNQRVVLAEEADDVSVLAEDAYAG